VIEALLDSLWQGAFIVAVAVSVTALVPRRHAATRYAVWFVSLLALAILPLIGLFTSGLPESAIPITVLGTARAASHLAEETSNAGGIWLAAIWGAGILACATRAAVSYLWLNRIMRSAAAAPQIGERVFTSQVVAMPIAAGLWHPVVVLPDELAHTLAQPDLEAIVAHEHAHIARNDIFGNVIQRAIESLLFFNPWVYAIGHQLVKEREAACDDWAVRAGSDPDRYASCLARLCLRSPRLQTSFLTPSAIWPERMLVGRIARLLNGKAIQVKTNYAVVAAAIALFALLGFAFQNPRGLAANPNCSSPVAIVNAAQPDVPESDAKAHPHAAVTLAVTVTAHGQPSDIEIVKVSGSNPAIVTAAVHAARDSTYKPEIRNCKAVSGGKYLFHVEIGP
jgi:beta-lactamase regulating signal transducer with metallopeptidase domain